MSEASQRTPAPLGAGGHWRNSVGNPSFIARHKGAPASEDELAAMVAQAARENLPVRVAGSGHSFTPVVATSGLLLSLEAMQGVVGADLARKRVAVRAGTKIGDIGRALKAMGLSLANQGDIDTQAIAGALSTGTHGTGLALGCLSTQAVGMRLVQADCEILDLDIDAAPEAMAAAQVAIGMLGVMSTVTLQVVDAGMLSPCYRRASVTISVSGGPGVDYWNYLADVDAILRQFGARPHWGKLHFDTCEDMPALDPRYVDFQAIRRRLDPQDRFLNDHLRALFG